jgi:septum site-determining protein MinD
MEKAIAIVSGKGGVGKTTLSANLGLAFKNLGMDVTVLDGDMSNANLGLQLGFFQFPLGMHEALSEGVGIGKAAYTHPSGLKVVPCSISMGYLKRSPNMVRLRRLLQKERGMILVDSPPGIGRDVQSIIRSCNDVIVLATPEIPAITDALKVIQLSREIGTEPLGMVLNRTGDKFELRPEEAEAMCGARVLGSIPEDRSVKRSIFNRNPVLYESPLSKSSLAFMQIASQIAGLEYKSPRMVKLRRLVRRW